VSGVGYEHARDAGVDHRHDIRRVVTNLGVFDFETSERTMRVRSLHPGVSFDEAREATGFDLETSEDIALTREPTEEELHLIRDVIDPSGLRRQEVPGA
jgi:acyl CoA:acetate/3-ketoacid CoA transferase beta subunit